MALFPAVVFGLLTFWLHRRLVRATALARPWSIVVDIVLVGMWALALIGFASGRALDPSWARPVGTIGLIWLATFFYLFLGLAIIGLISFGAHLIRWARRRLGGVQDTPQLAGRRLRRIRIATSTVVVVALAVTGYGVWEASRPQVVEVSATLDDLPEQFDGLRIAVVSDLHVGPARDASFTRGVVDKINEQHPDLVVLVGDLTDGTIPHVRDTLAPLADLKAPLGVFGVSGNHEYYADDGGRWLDVWEEYGVRTLRNSRVPLERNGATIELAGVYDATAPEPYEPDLPAALAGSSPDDFVLLLAHQPKQAVEASDLGVDLQFSGHTHGGQLWPIRYLVPLQQPSVIGLDEVGDTTLYTTRGAGAWGPPVRVLAPPEITILTLGSAG
ncbi:metallophosphoesterase [Gordonia sp. zg691]|uniref:Metallophosphoesterase n=1 Tax=Gordonia jinghuaiqii TaxID=2758710 RepID=A0A7D7R1V0_9ACTN|nr:metallophosphoesterase [Gordonia jinghuaiqii]MBD0863586.1 metallophosphoesterase [Gordonia jinghuaiqii]MCR5979322.1 metallophosphoesterase [Gordonia jinghuaiqii]QMT01107.1 metallophosphoesterase [Gordonia jinghuaiqii]